MISTPQQYATNCALTATAPINLSSDIELTNLSTGTGTKTINGNGHVIFLKGQGDLITVGLFSYLILNSCVIDGSRTYDNTPGGGTDLIHARIGRVDANWCTFQNNKANYGSSAYVSAMLDCSYGGQSMPVSVLFKMAMAMDSVLTTVPVIRTRTRAPAPAMPMAVQQ